MYKEYTTCTAVCTVNLKGKGSQMATLKIKYPYPPSEG